MFIISIVIGFLSCFVGTQQGSCYDDFPFKRLMEGTPRSRYEYRGRYVNWAYEYSVRIPKGLVGYDGRDEARHSGFGLVLGKASQSYVFVSAEPNSLEYTTPREAAVKDVEYLRQSGKTIESETITESHLGTLNAALLVVTYTCAGSEERYIKSSIVAISPKNGFVYTLRLYSPAKRYKKDRAVLDRIIKSWKSNSCSSGKRK